MGALCRRSLHRLLAWEFRIARGSSGVLSLNATPQGTTAVAADCTNAAPGNGSGTNGKITVRMYRVGFGDCFLITLATAAGPQHILVDCGVHNRGNIVVNGTSLLEKAFQNICEVTGRKLAVVVATHAHQDHISGFGKFAAQFAQFSIGEVWMPWTEDRNDQQAQRWRTKKAALLGQLQDHFAALGAAATPAAVAAVANMSVDQRALDGLHSGFGTGATIRFLKAGDALQSIASLPGLSVQVLGPPQDQQLLSRMNPPAGQSYLRLNGDEVVRMNSIRPFIQRWRVTPEEMPADWPVIQPSDIEELHLRASGSLDGLAFALDQVVNNTSIVGLFTYRSHHLLFAGDAQWGNWDAWLSQPNSCEILRRICFYKVAHHGSANATPKSALEAMTTGQVAAMISTQNSPWPSIPRVPLVDALDRQTKRRFVRSDSLPIPGAPEAPSGPPITSLPEGFTQGEFWYDYTIP